MVWQVIVSYVFVVVVVFPTGKNETNTMAAGETVLYFYAGNGRLPVTAVTVALFHTTSQSCIIRSKKIVHFQELFFSVNTKPYVQFLREICPRKKRPHKWPYMLIVKERRKGFLFRA